MELLHPMFGYFGIALFTALRSQPEIPSELSVSGIPGCKPLERSSRSLASCALALLYDRIAQAEGRLGAAGLEISLGMKFLLGLRPLRRGGINTGSVAFFKSKVARATFPPCQQSFHLSMLTYMGEPVCTASNNISEG